MQQGTHGLSAGHYSEPSKMAEQIDMLMAADFLPRDAMHPRY